MAKAWHRTYEYRQARAILLATTDLCHLCGHHKADTADHIISPLRGGIWRGGVAHVLTNLAPAHGVHRCPTCHINCNRRKGTHTLAEMAPPTRHSEQW